ncbi:MAG: hypothetical protein LBT43_21030 [Prevotella sp.]|jgi:hypothetical protein|nr:hypothetical protein [Prevotella sp.]MDR2001415.1 hypothetical protein [Prevotella sp.]
MNIKITILSIILLAPVLLLAQSHTSETLNSLANKFHSPSDEYRPHVWWHWLGSNFSKEGITKDLEAMKEAGIGGATIFNISSSVQESHFPMENNPWPEQTFRSEAYWDALKHTVKEAKRLGLKIGLHGTPGYSTTGGPWIPEERGMKAIVSSKTIVQGGKIIDFDLPKPALPEFTGYDSKYVIDYKPWKATKYWDLAVMAVPVKQDILVNEILEISQYMDSTGRLKWQAPEGTWQIYRYGYAPTMAHPHPLPDDIIGKAWEVDKMNREDNLYHWQQLLDPLKEHIGEYFGDSFIYIWVDSYEAGYQNWTRNFREEFIRIKGYDPVPWIALYQSKNKKELIHGFSAWYSPKFESSLPEFQSFIKDYDDVVNRLFIDNGFGVAKEMLHKYGLKLYWEPYWGPFSTYEGTILADIPVDEFWISQDTIYVNSQIMEAAVKFNKRIIAAEAFTGAPAASRYEEDPAFLKHSADGGFASGKNLFFLHHWVHQPFDDKYQPGMGMGWWGTHFSRFQTWIKPAKAFFSYLSRCQMLLQQGDYIPENAYMTHRRTPEADIFFVINPDSKPQDTYGFPVKGRIPELWDAYRGTIRKTSKWKQQGDSVYVDLNLGKDESMFVVFPNINRTDYNILPEVEVLRKIITPVDGVWDVAFNPKLDKPFKRKFHILVDWSRQDDEALKYFSGTVKYEKTILVSAEDLGKNKLVNIDLGELQDIAELEINGQNAGVLWLPPYKTDITPYLKPGKNKLAIYITNNWANRLIGDEQYLADFEWGTDRGGEGRAMKAFPEWFLKNQLRPSKGRKTFNVWYYYRKDSLLHPAGLFGPVRLIKENIR